MKKTREPDESVSEELQAKFRFGLSMISLAISSVALIVAIIILIMT